MIWPLSSCACDHHLRSTVMITIVTGATPWSPSWHHCRFRHLLLIRLLLPLSDKVKQLHGDCISYNKATTIRLQPVADNFYKTSCLDHITSQHALQKQVRRPLLCLLQVLHGCYGLKQEPILPTHQNHNDSLSSWWCFNLRKDRA